MGTAEQDFTAFYGPTWARTVACAYAVTGGLGAAEETAQEAYTKAWPRWSKLATYDDPGAWVRQVASRQAISRWRRATPARCSRSHRVPGRVRSSARCHGRRRHAAVSGKCAARAGHHRRRGPDVRGHHGVRRPERD